MKIYQITKFGGEWEDSYEYVEKTYLSKEKAEQELNRLNNRLDELKQHEERCDSCTVNYGYYIKKEVALSDMSKVLEECPFAELGMSIENDGIYLSCENNSDWRDDIYGYSIREYEVII